MTRAAIVGWSHTPFGKLEDPDVEHLMARVSAAALDHAGIPAESVDGVFVGVMNNGFSKQGFEAAQVALGLPSLAHVPAVRLENACATGSAALYAAADFIDSGRGQVALVVGAEKMTAVTTTTASDILLSASYRKEEADIDGGFAGVFSRIAAHYFQRYGDRSVELAHIAAKNHANGVANPYAQMRRDLGFDFCNTVSDRNPFVAAPLRRTDCSLISDGAAAIVVASADVADTLSRSIGFLSRTQVNDHLPLSRRDPSAFEGARRAWARALGEAGLAITDLDLVETHDCFTIAELIEYEAMGLAAPGEGYRVVREGIARKDGALPVNPSGGLKSKGHPIGATGVSQHIMACLQLTGEAEGMQLARATRAGVFNMGGAAVANYVSILERRR
jgi:acetyl-CoA C-acetyltransferase